MASELSTGKWGQREVRFSYPRSCPSRQGRGIFQIPINDGIGGAIGERQDCRCGICRGVLRERGCSEHEKIRELPVLQVGIHDGTFWRTSHDGAALNVGRLVARCIVTSRSEEHTSELQSQSNLVCRLLLEKKKKHK